MQRRFFNSLVLGSGILILAAAPLAAQERSGASVSGVGSVDLDCPPQVYRLQMVIGGKGKTLAEALDVLKKHREEALKKLQSFGAEMDTVKFGSPLETVDASEVRKKMAAMMASRFRKAGRDPKSIPVAVVAVVKASLNAEWKLKEGTPDELLLQMNDIKTKVEGADLAGTNSDKSATPEEEEASEEQSGPQGFAYASSNEQQSPETPVFTVVVKLSDADHQKALTAAYAKAVAQATMLAKAAESGLGKLQSIDSNTAVNSSAYEEEMVRQQMYGGRMGYPGRYMGGENEELVSMPTGKVSVRILVRATFGLH